MTKRLKAKSPILEAMHETASDLNRLGFIDQRKMHEFDALCLGPIPEYDSKKIRAVRQRLKISQAVLAAVLNTSLSTVRRTRSARGISVTFKPCGARLYRTSHFHTPQCGAGTRPALAD